jgi:hypothetical protein
MDRCSAPIINGINPSTVTGRCCPPSRSPRPKSATGSPFTGWPKTCCEPSAASPFPGSEPSLAGSAQQPSETINLV